MERFNAPAATLAAIVLLLGSLPACDSDDATKPEEPITDVTTMLASVCELAALCPDITVTDEDLAACPANLLSKLSQNQLAAVTQFTTYDKARQDCILECMGINICDRFGVGLPSISDADLVETYVACEAECP
jgi:hypothetical protein